MRRARSMLALQAELADLVRLGAYQRGADPAADEALLRAPRIEALLKQHRAEALETGSVETAFAALSLIMDDGRAG